MRGAMGFGEAVRTCLTRYAAFGGRASRPEYWWFALFVVLGTVVLALLDAALFGAPADPEEGGGLLASLFQLATLLPLLAAGWRRMHDTGRSGLLLLLPMALSLLTVLGLLGGVVTFSALEGAGADPEALRGPAALLGVGGLMAMGLLQLVVAALMLWWLTRPGDPGPNAYGPPPV